MIEAPTFVIGLIFLASAAWALTFLPPEYRAQRRLPRWMLPLPRLWSPQRDVLMARVVAAMFALGGLYLILSDLAGR